MKYICDPHIVPSVVPSDLVSLESYSKRVAFARSLHVDIADGTFARNTTWPFTGITAGDWEALAALVLGTPETRFGVHLMTRSPRELGEKFARAGFSSVTGHVEAFTDAEDISATLASWKKSGAEAGIALNIDTPLSSLGELRGFDIMHLMAIRNIGEQGEPFDERILSRVEEAHAEYPDTLVAVDGGVSEASVEELVRAGANRLIVGHRIAESENPERTYTDILERAMRGCIPTESGMQKAESSLT
jgi:ribulose-phosphate 3-epimerase